MRTPLHQNLNSAIEAAVTPAVEAALAPLSFMLDGIRSTAEEQGRHMDAFEHDMCDYSDRIVALEETGGPVELGEPTAQG
ncbi:hypothetical protein DPEC_G00057870 [Dallia pectoralis]|uniref:Uncharacterized protein n=1 Tax=Dallia pectoralis TaxID=75939 RepID=A0ACC2H6N0_DALPE|nr:hypothetical protein DPEC_G00057870 [Dallia pectoralis]